MPIEEHRKSLWMGIGEKVISFVIGIVIASFFLGGARQRVTTLGKEWDDWNTSWKTVHNPRLERMDSQGTLSFQHWKGSYDKEQTQQYGRIQKVEDAVSHLEAMELRIERLERNHNTQQQQPRSTRP